MSVKSCIRCEHYLACKDQRKSIIHSCERFKVTTQSLRQEKAILEDALELPFRTSTLPQSGLLHMPGMPTRDTGFDAYESLKAVLADKRIVSPDIKIPEGDFPEAPNFYTWCVSDQFLDQKPFVMQAMLGTRLFAEYCPDCSDVDWMDNGCKVNTSLGKFTRKVALLQYGKCPYCHKTKLHFFRKGTLAPYWEMALSAGQRSGKSALFGMLASYLTHRMIKLERPNEVFGLLKANVLQGTFVALTHAQAKDTLWEPFYGHLLEAPWFCIAEDTEVSLANGTTKAIQDIEIGDLVETLDGSDVVTNVFDNGVKECLMVTLCDGNALPGTAEHQVRCLSDDGESLVWKDISSLTEDDYVVSQNAG